MSQYRRIASGASQGASMPSDSSPFHESRHQHGAIRAMTYTHDGFGLGHLRRTTNIASRLVQDVPGSSVLMLVGCSLGSFFELPTGVDCLKVPSIIKTGNGVYHPLSLHVTVDEMKALRASTIQEAVRVFKPKLLLVDHKPTGV